MVNECFPMLQLSYKLQLERLMVSFEELAKERFLNNWFYHQQVRQFKRLICMHPKKIIECQFNKCG